MSILSFDPEKYFLGKLCKYAHTWNGTDQSLRNHSSRSCYECCKIATKNWRQQNTEKIKEYRKEYWRNNPRQRPSEYYREYYRRNPEVYKQAKKLYREKNLEKVRASAREYTLRTWREQYRKHYAKLLIYRRQRRHKVRGLRVLSYTLQDLANRLQFFQHKCVYCQSDFGGDVKLHWDHLVPIAKNGHDALYNLVPACQYCNCQKWMTDALEWYSKQPFFSHSQWELICEVCGYQQRSSANPEETR